MTMEVIVPKLKMIAALDFEVEGHGPYAWSAWVGDIRVAHGRASSKLALNWSVTWRTAIWRVMSR